MTNTIHSVVRKTSRNSSFWVCATFLGIGSAAFAHGALAQSKAAAGADNYPARPIRFVVPSSPGGVVTRLHESLSRE